jgi:hypothetical protein
MGALFATVGNVHIDGVPGRNDKGVCPLGIAGVRYEIVSGRKTESVRPVGGYVLFGHRDNLSVLIVSRHSKVASVDRQASSRDVRREPAQAWAAAGHHARR